MLGTLLGFAAAIGTKIPLKFPANGGHHDISIGEAHTIMLFPEVERSQNITFSLSTDQDHTTYKIKDVIGINFGIRSGTVVTFNSNSAALLHVHLFEPQIILDEYIVSTYPSDHLVIATNKTSSNICTEVSYPADVGSYGFVHVSGAPTNVRTFATNLTESCSLRYQLGDSKQEKTGCFSDTIVKTDGGSIFTVKFGEYPFGAFAVTFMTKDDGVFGLYRRYFHKSSDLTLLRSSDSENIPRKNVRTPVVCREIRSDDYPQQTPEQTPSESPRPTATTPAATRSPSPSHSPTATRSFMTRSRSPKPLVMHQGDTFTVSFARTAAIIVGVVVLIVCFVLGLFIARKIWPSLTANLRMPQPKKKMLISQEEPLVQKSEPEVEQVLSDEYGVPRIL